MGFPVRRATKARYRSAAHTLQLKAHVHAFLMAFNFAKLSPQGPGPYERICKVWTTQPNLFRLKTA